MIVLYKKHIAIRREPKNLKKEDVSLFSHEFSKEIKEATLTILRNANVLNNLIFTIQFKFYPEYTRLNTVSAKQKLKIFLSLFHPCKKLNKAVWITDDLSFYYFHWFTDALPRLIASEKFLNIHSVLLPNEYKKYSYILQSLEILNISVIFFEPEKRLHIRELILPNHIAPTGNYNKEVINIVRSKFFSDSQKTANKRIYISREKAIRRKITNENELTELLKLYDFEVHFFEDYSFYKQVELSQQATHLIGLHGAGLTNMLFMREKGKILELRNEADEHNNCYFSLASDLDHDYYYFVCQSDNPDIFHANLTVDINSLKSIIEQMIL